jgi:hypothetical protein
MIERQIESPMPMPPGLVVKKEVNSRGFPGYSLGTILAELEG